MSDIDGAAPAAAEGTVAPEAHVQPPAPIDSQGPQPEAPAAEQAAKADAKTDAKPERSASVADALKKADAEAKAKAAEKAQPDQAAKDAAKGEKTPDKGAEKPDAKPVETKGPQRGEDGKFAPREPKADAQAKDAQPQADQAQTTFREPPRRFSDDAKAAWEAAPDPVKAEVHRAIKEMEAGINEYRQKFEPLKEYERLATENKTSIRDALDRYTGLERALTSPDPNARFNALRQVFDYAGLNMHEFAAQIAGVDPNQVAVQSEQQLQSLRQEVSQLRSQLQGYQQKEQQALLSKIEEFASAHSRFDELAPKIVKLIESGLADSYEDAYVMADRLIPGAAQPEAASSSPVQPDPAPQPRPAPKSVSGSPSPGSSPDKRKPSNSIREALLRAQASAV